MSSSSRRARQPIDELCKGNAQPIIHMWWPDWGAVCRLCGETPCVTGLCDRQVVYESHMCGACTFGDSECIDPGKW